MSTSYKSYKSPYEKYKEKMTEKIITKKSINENPNKKKRSKIFDNFVKNSIINTIKEKREKIIIPIKKNDFKIYYENKKKTKSVKFNPNPIFFGKEENKNGFEKKDFLNKKKKGILKKDEHIYNPVRLRNSLYDYSAKKKKNIFTDDYEKLKKSKIDYKIEIKNLNGKFRNKKKFVKNLFADEYLKNTNFKINVKNKKLLNNYFPLERKKSNYVTKSNMGKINEFGKYRNYRYSETNKNLRYSEKNKNLKFSEKLKNYDFNNFERKKKNIYDTYKNLYKKNKDSNNLYNTELKILKNSNHYTKFSKNF